MFSCEYCEILKNTYSQEHLPTTIFLYGAVAHDPETYDFMKFTTILWTLTCDSSNHSSDGYKKKENLFSRYALIFIQFTVL